MSPSVPLAWLAVVMFPPAIASQTIKQPWKQAPGHMFKSHRNPGAGLRKRETTLLSLLPQLWVKPPCRDECLCVRRHCRLETAEKGGYTWNKRRDTSGESDRESHSSSGMGCGNFRLPLRLKLGVIRLRENAFVRILFPSTFLYRAWPLQTVCSHSITCELGSKAESQDPPLPSESNLHFHKTVPAGRYAHKCLRNSVARNSEDMPQIRITFSSTHDPDNNKQLDTGQI